jgi:hypothetical protein
MQYSQKWGDFAKMYTKISKKFLLITKNYNLKNQGQKNFTLVFLERVLCLLGTYESNWRQQHKGLRLQRGDREQQIPSLHTHYSSLSTAFLNRTLHRNTHTFPVHINKLHTTPVMTTPVIVSEVHLGRDGYKVTWIRDIICIYPSNYGYSKKLIFSEDPFFYFVQFTNTISNRKVH